MPPSVPPTLSVTIIAIFSNYKFFFTSTLAAWCLTSTQVDTCLSAVTVISGLALAGGVEGLAWRQAAADRGFPFSPSWFHGCDITSVALLLRVMSLCLSGCRVGTITIKGSPTYRKRRGKKLTFVLVYNFRDARVANLLL